MLALLRSLVARTRELARRPALDAERDEEFLFHIEMQTAHNRRLGMSDSDARRAAMVAFGGRERFREEARDARGFALLDNTWRDTRFALRRLRRAPAFACGVIVTLAVGAGTAVAIGTLVYGVLVRPLPYPESHRVVQVTFRTPGLDGGKEHAHSEATYVHLREASRSFAAVGAFHLNDGLTLTDGDDPQRVTGVLATPSVLAVLRVVPAAGQLFSQADAEVPGSQVIPVMISHALWQRRYGSDPGIVGRVIEINRRPRRVVGVLPVGFAFPTPTAAVWYPLDITGQWPALNNRYLEVIARLGNGVHETQAEADLRQAIPGITARFPKITIDDVVRSKAYAEVHTLKESVIAPVRPHLRLLALTMLFVMLIAAANVANLFLLRAERSRHELAIARALGGGWIDLARRFMLEGVLLGVAGGIVAIPLVVGSVRSRFGFTAREIPRLHEVGLSAWPVVSVILMTLLIGALVAMAAMARAWGTRPAEGLRVATSSVTGTKWRRAQHGLVALQVAVALTLLLGAGLMGRSLLNLRKVDLGFKHRERATFEITLPFSGYNTYSRVALFHAAVLDRLRALPGVRGAEAAMEVPLIQEYPGALSLGFDGVGAGTEVRAAANMATAGYFRLMDIPLLHGRTFMAGDLRAENPAIVLSASLARELFGTQDAVGRLVRPPSPGRDYFFRVVGVVGDVPRWRIEDGPVSMAYFPQLSDGDGVPGDSIIIPLLMSGARYVFHSELPVAELAPAIRNVLREIDSRVPVTNISSLDAMVEAATAKTRLTMLLLFSAAGAALILGIVGIYSVVSYTVAGRQREFGVRLALGATPARIQRMVLRDGLTLIAMGLMVGLVSALAGSRMMQSLLYGVSPSDPAMYAVATALLLMVAMIATLLPARRAAGVNPVEVMRGEA